MRANTNALVRTFREVFDLSGPVLEIGALQTPGQEGWADLRPLFPGASYVGIDKRPGPGVDAAADAETALPFPNGQFRAVVALDALEHVYDVAACLREMERVLAPGGLLLAASVMYYPVHDHPHDYWRFTPEAFRRLFAPLGPPLVLSQGPADFPHTVAAVVRKGGRLDAAEAAALRSAAENMPEANQGCAWRHPGEAALRAECEALRAYHAQWDPSRMVSKGFDPDLSRRFYASLCWKSAAWLGAPIWQIPTDLMALQELLTHVRPKTVLETGTNRGGSAAFFASMLTLLRGADFRVISIEKHPVPGTRERLDALPGGQRVALIEGDSAAPEVAARAARAVRDSGAPVLVALDADHSYAHVRAELAAYHGLVSDHSYLVVLDTVTRYLHDVPHGDPAWRADNAHRAVEEFLGAHPEFIAERAWEHYLATFAPLGFLRRRAAPDTGQWRPSSATLEPVEDAPEAVRCITYEGAVWGGLTLGCTRNNVCDGVTAPCAGNATYTLTFGLTGEANLAGVSLALNAIDDQHRRLAETVLPLTPDRRRIAFTFTTRPGSTHLGLQLVKARCPAPAVFVVDRVRLDRQPA